MQGLDGARAARGAVLCAVAALADARRGASLPALDAEDELLIAVAGSGCNVHNAPARVVHNRVAKA